MLSRPKGVGLGARAGCVLLVIAAAGSGCEIVLGIDKHDSRAAGDDASIGDDASAADAAPTCVLPSRGDATLRISHLLAAPTRVDLCVRRTDGASALEGKPVIASSGAACPNGLQYKDVTAPIAIDAGAYELRVIPAGGACGDAPMATTTATLAARSATTLFVLGGPKRPKALALAESRPQRLDTKLRFVNAIDGGPSLDMGFVDHDALPAMVTNVFFADVASGGVARPGRPDGGTESVDANGYIELSAPGGKLQIGASVTGSTDAILAIDVPLAGNDGFTLAAIGSASDARFPRELFVCDEGKIDGIYTRCGTAPPFDVKVDTVNAYLWGPFAPLEKLRRGPVAAALAKLDSDVVCVTEVWSDADKQAIADAAKARFPNALIVHDTLATAVDDPTDESGNVPPAPTAAPCAGDPRFEPLLACVRDSCSTAPGDDAATIIDDPVACMTQSCQAKITPLLFGAASAQACWSCALTSLEGAATIGATRTACTTDPRARYAFGGANSVMLLSRFPIASSEQWVLPSTEWRASVLRAELVLPNGSPFDAYCTEITSPQTGPTHPYTGAYGGTATDSNHQWLEEQTLQTKKLVAYTNRRSGARGRRAVLAGELYAGPSAGGLDPINAAAFDLLGQAFPVAARPDYAPACTFCAENPITTPPGQTPTVVSTWTTLALLVNMPVTDVVTSSVILKERAIPYASYAIPVSPYYDYRATIRVRP